MHLFRSGTEALIKKETKKEVKMQLWPGWGHAQQVLSKIGTHPNPDPNPDATPELLP